MIISKLIAAIEQRMYGHNFEVKLGFDVFNGSSEADFFAALKGRYPDADTTQTLIAATTNSLVAHILACFNYRGDDGAGLKLSVEKERKLLDLQQQYFDVLEGFLGPDAQPFVLPNYNGLPGYPVWWDFRYVIFSDANRIALAYGSSSD
ncbi:hypothetical protein ACFOTA_16600 [Chitinophaga sp. GCM10012297]|uniref:Uncharacterized protein n=1 Tax=Chitinophaga chungangae TaxID=2821488 RepID=A0ABS3YGM3_9BACT|nr:hypothetical protein [Chitinophaga chungangae]MBO9153842.1 hypothetical protein [Chitinophaga chungangae]